MTHLYLQHNTASDLCFSANTHKVGGREEYLKVQERLNNHNDIYNADIDADTSMSALSFFEAELRKLSARTASSYAKALDSFNRAVPLRDIRPELLSQAHVAAWIDAIARESLKLSTACYYLDCMAAIAGRIEPIDAAIFKHESAGATVSAPSIDGAAAMHRIAKMNCSNTSLQLAIDILLFSQYCGGMPLAEIIALKASDMSALPAQAHDIAAKYVSARREAIFPLLQTRRTPNVIEQEWSRKLASLLSTAKTAINNYTPALAAEIWVETAMAAGIAPAEARSAVWGNPVFSTALQLVTPDALTDRRKSTVLEVVAESLTHAPMHWYAMRMRRGIAPDDIEARLRDNGARLPEIFYPTDEIVRRVGKRMVRESKAILPEVLFFRAQPDAIAPMFRIIGDMAWCYRTAHSSAAPYAIISPVQMQAFQRIIGCFTPDVELHPYAVSTLGVGRRVRITAGVMAGYEGIIHDEINLDSASPLSPARRIFTLRLLSDLGLQWSINLDESFIEEI